MLINGWNLFEEQINPMFADCSPYASVKAVAYGTSVLLENMCSTTICSTLTEAMWLSTPASLLIKSILFNFVSTLDMYLAAASGLWW